MSAAIGVACARWVSGPLSATAGAVGLAIGAMHDLWCIHRPGGATAFTDVVGGAQLQGMRFEYVLTTVLLNAMMIVGVALAFNDPFRWRRYPAALVTTRAPSEIRKQLGEDLSEKDMDRPYARAYAFSGLRALSSLSVARSAGSRQTTTSRPKGDSS
jgi:CBS-domain-containing membrane protein